MFYSWFSRWRAKRMLKELRFTFSAPLCECKTDDGTYKIKWSHVTDSKSNLTGISFECKICEAKLFIPRSNLGAHMIWGDQDGTGNKINTNSQKTKSSSDKAASDDSNKVIQFPRKDKTE